MDRSADDVDLRESYGASSARLSRVDTTKPAPRIMILSSTLGSGHQRAAEAIEMALVEAHSETTVRVVDFWELMDHDVAAAAKQAYLDLTQHRPDLYDTLFKLDSHGVARAMAARRSSEEAEAGFRMLADVKLRQNTGRPADGPMESYLDRALYRILAWAFPGTPGGRSLCGPLMRQGAIAAGSCLLAERLYSEIMRFRPDGIVTTQMLPGHLFARISDRLPFRVSSVSVIVNWGMIEFYDQDAIEFHCVPHAAVANHACDTLRVTGIPLMPGFSLPPAQPEARAMLGLQPDLPAVLVQGGGLGLNVASLAERLLDETHDLQLIVQTGQNAQAMQQLAALGPSRRLHVVPWVEDMPLYLRAADVVVGKPGGLTVAECLACGRPMLVTDTICGQESRNAEFLEAQGVGWRVREEDLAGRLAAMLDDAEGLKAIQHKAWNLGARDAATRIARLVVAGCEH